MPLFEGLIASFHKAIEKHDNRHFLEAVMATCAIVASSDGAINFSERGRLDQIINFVDRLKIYDPHEAVDLFNEYVDRLKSKSKIEKKALLDMIKTTIRSTSDKKLVLKICWNICKADGDIKRAESDAIEEIAINMGLSIEDVFRNY